jgi:hypothetical protein
MAAVGGQRVKVRKPLQNEGSAIQGRFRGKKGVFSEVRKKVKMSNRTTSRPLATGSGKTAVKASFTPHWQGDKAK